MKVYSILFVNLIALNIINHSVNKGDLVCYLVNLTPLWISHTVKCLIFAVITCPVFDPKISLSSFYDHIQCLAEHEIVHVTWQIYSESTIFLIN